ncbi:MAG: NADH-quinone oxidoreductase subunit N [Deltaproteobacteria bacterium]|nr:NADH-quinone oxidoreductase subunit N [Deltaproteobacteria bacterium]
MAVFVADILVKKSERGVAILAGIAFLTLGASGAATWFLSGFDSQLIFSGLIAHDALAIYFKWLFLAATALAVWMAIPSKEIVPSRLGEYFALLLTMCLGMNLMASSVDLLMVYLSLEMVSIVSYILAGYRRGDRRAAEASLKYVIYGAVASGIMLFGISYLYGLLGTTNLNLVQARLASFDGSNAGGQVALLVTLVFVLSGVGYKVASVPWHMWCPDVYEGAPTPFTAFLSVAPKAAGFAVALRLFFGGMASVPNGGLDQMAKIAAGVPWPAVLGAVAAATMTLGNLAALNQNNLKRLLAYSSIAHAGYVMMGLASASNLGNQSVLVYLTFYLLMNIGAFLVVEMISRSGGSESIFEYRGLAKRAPFAAVAFAILLFSLTGLPPLAGFIGKFYLFYAVIQKAGAAAATGDATGWWALAVIGVLNSAVSLYYYARVVKAMFLEKGTEERPLEFPVSYTGMLAGLTGLVVLFGIYWAPVSEAAANAIKAMAG